MFARLFGWQEHPKSAQPIALNTPESVEKIKNMLFPKQPLDDVLACIHAASVEDLNQPLKTHGIMCEYAYAPLLRYLRGLQSYQKNDKEYYIAIEQHLLKKGVKKDTLYRWLLEKERQKVEGERSNDSEDEQLIEIPFFPDTSLLYVAFCYLAAVQSDRQLGNERDKNIACLKSLIEELSVEEINQPVFTAPDLTLLHYAASFGDAEMTQFLIKRGADISIGAKDRVYMTPLLYALAAAGFSDFRPDDMKDINATINMLLDNGADPHAKTYLDRGCGNVIGRIRYGGNESALNICMKTDNITMAISLMKDHGVDPRDVQQHLQEKVDKVCEENNIYRPLMIC